MLSIKLLSFCEYLLCMVMAGTVNSVDINLGDTVDKAKGMMTKYKIPIIVGCVVAVLIFFVVCCCMCRRCLKKKKRKAEEKLKMKGAKLSKKLARIQPNKAEKRAMEELGTIKFTLRYDLSSEMLLLTVHESEEIPVRDLSGYAYSFVLIKITPLHENIHEEYKTNLVRAGFWPHYGQSFSFVIEPDELNRQVLYLYQYELNRWSKQDGIGQITCELKDIGLMTGKDFHLAKKLRPYDPLIGLDVEAGAVMLTISYDMETWELTVAIHQSDIIPMDEDKEKANSYVTLTLLNKEDELLEKRKSRTKRGTLHPEYDDEVQFTVPENLLPEVKILVQLKSPRLLGRNVVIGKTTILPNSDNWKQLLDKGTTEGWFSVFTKPKKDD